ncbi:MAG: thioredoxin family protein [Bacteroidales bacterium]|nr:thioredoxin family protein [Bacteroidales bacterium]
MKNLLFLAIILIPAMTFAQMNQKTSDAKKGNEMLIGYCNRDGFTSVNSNFDSAFKAEYPVYKADEATMKQLAGKLNDIEVTVVMATWCGDSKEWVPRFYKIMDSLDFPYKKLTLICVDRTKKAPGINVDALKIELVPTFIFYRKDVELGRIIEVPADLMEKEILKIISK